MKHLIVLTAFVLFASLAQAQYNYETLQPATEFTPEQQKLYTYQNLRIYPVYAKEKFLNVNKNVGKYTPLKDALTSKKVVISEKGSNSSNLRNEADAEVNSLYIQNTSKDTVYIMGGEVVKGGKQDRVIAQDVILPPGGKKVSLDVYCVEHGRWVHNSGSGNNFNSTTGVTSLKVRKAAEVTKNQSMVWSEVKDVTVKNKTETSTGTYNSLTSSKEYTDKLKKYTDYFKTQLSKEKNVIGFAAASGDSIIGCDMFATSVLFNQQLDNLLQSYSTEAITNGKPVTITKVVVKNYFDNLLVEKSQKETIKKDGKEFKLQDKTLHMSIYK